MSCVSSGPLPHYAGGIWKRRFHSENAWNVSHPHYAGEILKRTIPPVILDFRFRPENSENHMIIVAPSFAKSRVFKMFSVHTKTRSQRFQISPVWCSVFEKLRFRDGLAWTVGLTVEIKLRFQIPQAYCGPASDFWKKVSFARVGSWNRVSKVTDLAGCSPPQHLWNPFQMTAFKSIY